jgi:hypothetical protein
MSVEDVFAKVVGRSASEEERARLYRLRDALGLRDNDAFWAIVMALEHYDSFFRAYPEILAEKTAQCIESARATFAFAANQEAARAQRHLSERVAQTSVEIARKLADRPVGLHRITAALAAAVAFGALCVHTGYDLASSDRPFWAASRASDLRGPQRAIATVLSVPAGWMIFALLVPAGLYAAKAGWAQATDPLADRGDRAIGWCILALCVFAGLAAAVLLVRLA